MNQCPITYEPCGEEKYSKKGLQLLSRGLKQFHDFPYSAQEQLEMALQLATKLSIQGVQPKLSVKLNVASQVFEIVERGGTFIVKPPHRIYQELPENEDLTMRLAKAVGIHIPLHGLMYNKDGSFSYFIKRFDRISKGHKLALEDFSQLLSLARDTKYESSMEKVVLVIDKHCTFPLLEKIKIFRLTLFNFLIGNEDMHLKNFSLIRQNNKIEMSPAYDLLNTTIVLKAQEEIALPIRGKKSNLNRFDLIEYYGKQRLGLSDQIIQTELENFVFAFPTWQMLIQKSFLSHPLKERYKTLLETRSRRIWE